LQASERPHLSIKLWFDRIAGFVPEARGGNIAHLERNKNPPRESRGYRVPSGNTAMFRLSMLAGERAVLMEQQAW